MSVHASFLTYLKAVADHGSIRQAARALDVAPSALNRQILKVEQSLALPLFNRTGHGMQPTTEGQLLVDHVTRTLLDYERTLKAIQSIQNAGRYIIEVGGQESIIVDLLPPVLVEFHARHSNVSTSFTAAGGDKLLHLLAGGSIDITLMFDAKSDSGIRQINQQTLPVGAIIPRSHPLSTQRSVEMAQCAEYPLILPDHSWPLRGRLDEMLSRNDLIPSVQSSSNSVEFLRSMLGQPKVVGFQTPVGAERLLQSGDLQFVTLVDQGEPVTQTLCLCIRDDEYNSAETMELANALSDHLTHYALTWNQRLCADTCR